MFSTRRTLAVVVAVSSLALSGCSSTGTNTSGAATPTSAAPTGISKVVPAPSASKGLASKEASGDVKLGAIRVDAKLGSPSAEITITNRSSKRSNYIVDLSITSADGKTQLDAAMVSAQGVSPGQTTKRSAHFKTTQKLPAGAKLAVVGVARLVV